MDESTISHARAEEIVWRIVREERAEAPPPDAFAYLAEELRKFVAQYHKRQSDRSVLRLAGGPIAQGDAKVNP